jgi:RNA 2',3'-cyclic 3'-phosphodiesterase
MKRIFIAVRIEPEEPLLKMISSFKQTLKNESIKWTEIKNIHITLVFLGDTLENRVQEIDALLKEICRGFGSFYLIVRGAGVFKSLKDTRVIWTGIGHSDEMTRLHYLISDKLRTTGTELEERSFNPHLTLGRVKSISNISDLKSLLERYQENEIQKVKVNEIILYESILRPEGPVYNPLGKYSLD